MVNNYDTVLRNLARFIVDNAPAGAEREVSRLFNQLARGEVPDYIGLEFRPTDDTGAQLYVKVQGPEGRFSSKAIYDAEGNRWYAYVVKCEVSWATWGSAPVEVCQRRLAVMTEVTRFACDVERAFSEMFYRLDETADQIKERKERAVKELTKMNSLSFIKSHAKAMKTGQTKSLLTPVEYVGEHEFEVTASGRVMKYRALCDGAHVSLHRKA